MAFIKAETLAALASSVIHNRYTLTIDTFAGSPLSILSISGDESLNEPWHYNITFTSTNRQIEINNILNQPATLTFAAAPLTEQFTQLNKFTKPTPQRTLYGVITQFNLLSVSKEEACYEVVLSSRLAMLANSYGSAIYQNQSVVSVVESVLRSHGFTGIDFRFELSATYPVRELITKWQESDLAFIQRLLADVGINFWFESHKEHHCDVVVISDDNQKFEEAAALRYQTPSDMIDGGSCSVWDLQFSSYTKPSAVLTSDYNYRLADMNQLSERNLAPNDKSTYGTEYHYGEHHKVRGDEKVVESGMWYAALRHAAHLSHQLLICGKSNSYHLMPGQRLKIHQSGIEGCDEGVLILTVQSKGDRSTSYSCQFTAIPYTPLKPYRPMPLPMPTISGTLPARVTSPDNDIYGYIDSKGRYRVKFDFDLTQWKRGEESLWVRMARPYAGSELGFHFPLISGTEVAIAFSGGNPDRPYIAHSLHDSSHSDVVSMANRHRNVIRTPANNKLRMDDKRGQEHIKLATEYGKTQLNLGHLVNSEKVRRGEGFELRTDLWGAIAADKGLYLTAQSEPKAEGEQLDMQGAISQLENALAIAKALQNAAQNANAHPSQIDAQQALQKQLTHLTGSGIIAYAPDGIGVMSDENIQLSSGNNLTITTENQTDILAHQNLTLASAKAASLFAQNGGIKIIANQGKVEMQAQNEAMEIAARQDVKMESTAGDVDLTAQKEIIFVCGGSYLKIGKNGVEMGTSGNVIIKSDIFQKMGPKTLDVPALNLPNSNGCSEFFILTNDDTDEPLANHPYKIEVNGKTFTGVTDAKGKTERIFTDKTQSITGTPQDNRSKKTFLFRQIHTGKRVQLDFNELYSNQKGDR